MSEATIWRSRVLGSLGYTAIFFSREGGVSDGPLSWLNLGTSVDDDPAAIAENERRVLEAMGVGGLFLPKQVHGDRVALVHKPVTGVVRSLEADAAVAKTAAIDGTALGVLTADCAPILLGSTDGEVIGVIHAGWRGLLAGVVAGTIRRLTRAFSLAPGELAAAIGPTIGVAEYEVGADLAERFLRERADLSTVNWPDRRRKPRLNLRMIALKDLLAAGLSPELVEVVGPTTADTRLFSHRRNGGRTGRQLSAIARPKKAK